MKHETPAPKRILSLLLALLLTLTLLPTAALTANAATPETIYYKNTNNWSTVYAYFFANSQPVGASWPGSQMTNGGDFWSIAVPSGAAQVIFTNGSGEQTADLTIPTNGDAYYNNGWSATGTAGTVTDSYTVAGEVGLCGTEWDVGNTANDMTLSSGIYTKTYTGIAAGTYQFKVAKNHSWNTSYGNGSGNASVTVEEDGSTVTITFDPSSNKVSASVTAPTAEPDPTPTDIYTVAGSFLTPVWDPSAAANDMTLSNGVYTKAFENVAAGDHEFKVVKNRSWDTAYGDNGNNYTFSVGEDGSTVTVTFDPSTEKVSVTVTVPSTEPGPTPTDIYTVAGSFLTPVWDPSAAANDMTLSNGVYTKTFENVAAGDHEFKVVKNRSWDTAYGDNGNNYTFSVGEDGSTVTITFNADTKAITVDVKVPLYMNVNGNQVEVTAGANVLETLGTEYTWYLLKDGKRTQLYDNAVFPETTASYSNLAVSIEGDKSVGTSHYVCTGETLTAVHNAAGDVTYQWYAGTDAIPNATAASYTVEDAYVGKKIGVSVTTSYDTVSNINYPDNKKIPTVLAPADITVDATNATVTLGGETKNTAVLKYTDENGIAFTLTANEGYYLPSSVTYIRETDTKAKTLKTGATSNGIKYDANTGELSFTTASTKNGDITVTIVALAAGTKITYTDSEGEHSIYVGTLADAAKKAAALSAGGAGSITVQLLQDVTVTKNTETGAFTAGTYTLDLNGHTVTTTSASASAVSVAGDASLTIKDSSGGNGKLVCDNTSVNNAAVKVSGGSLTVSSGAITSKANAISATAGSSVTVNGGTITGAERALYCLGAVSVNVTGGTLTSTKATPDGNVVATNSAIVLKNGTGSTLSISGGSISGADNDISVENSTATVTLSGGTFPSGIKVTGTTLADIIADGCYYTADDNSIVTPAADQTEITKTVTIKKDETAPTITGVTDGATYYTTQKATAADDKGLSSVTVNGTPVTDPAAEIALEGNKVAEYVIVAKDMAGNETTVTVTMMPISTLAESIKDLTVENVKLTDKAAIEAVEDAVEAVDTTNATDAEKQALDAISDKCNALLETIDNAQDVIDMIEAIPSNAAPDNEKALAAEKAYDALTKHEQELVGEDNLAKLVKILTNYKITKGNGGKWSKKSGKKLSFTANGPYSKFIGITIDGKAVKSSNYTSASGSTNIALKPSYLETLSTGKHTIFVEYADGEASGIFYVNEAATSPSTGDQSGITIYILVAVLSAAALAVLDILSVKKRKQR